MRILPIRRLKRFVVKHFGSTKAFMIWLLIVVVLIYFIDTYLLTTERIQSLLASKASVPARPSLQGRLRLSAPTLSSFDDHALSTRSLARTLKNEIRASNLCDANVTCPPNQHTYYVKTGIGRRGVPTICFDGIFIISPEKNNANRGLNVVIINEKTVTVEGIKSFDVYANDASFIDFLQSRVSNDHLLLMASQDDASFHLSNSSKRLLHQFGSSLIDKMKFRDAFAMIGEKGLEMGKALEVHRSRVTGQEFSEPAEMKGCLLIPMLNPNTTRRPIVEEHVTKMPPVEKVSLVMKGDKFCGVQERCSDDAFPVHLYTGKENKDLPKICINGKYVISSGVNDAGRGLNIAVVSPITKQVIRVGHFDTFQQDSSNLEIFLEVLNDGDIVLVVSFDEASSMLSDHAKSLFNELGSALIQNMKFRDNWVFVGQKGISGFAEIEQIEFAGKHWPKPIEKFACIRTSLEGNKIKPDPLAQKNEKRRIFCSKYAHIRYGDFCNAAHVDEVLTPAPLSDKALENHAIFTVPIIVVPGLNFNVLRMQLETLLLNPGIRPEMVTVLSDETFAEHAASLAELFKYKGLTLKSSSKYSVLLQKAIETAWELHPNSNYIIFLEEETIPVQDFLSFMAQCLPVLDSDESLAGASAWNINGYKGVSTMTTLAYRTETFPGLGFMLKMSVYNSTMKNNMQDCCNKRRFTAIAMKYNNSVLLIRAWMGWSLGKTNGIEMIVPDVSRVYRRPYEGLSEQPEYLKEVFNRDRVTNLDAKSKLTWLDLLTRDRYEAELHRLVASSTALSTENVEDCQLGNGLGFSIPETKGSSYSIYFEQDDGSDERALLDLCRCFKLFHAVGHRVQGKHNGIVRFTFNENHIFLIGASTSFYKYRPNNYTPVRPRDRGKL